MKAKLYSTHEIHYCIPQKDKAKFVLRAVGIANSGGWQDAELIPWVYVEQPSDGIVDFDLVATPPDGMATFAMTELHTPPQVFNFDDWIKGVRVHSVSGSKATKFDLDPENTALMSDDDPAPFPWIVTC